MSEEQIQEQMNELLQAREITASDDESTNDSYSKSSHSSNSSHSDESEEEEEDDSEYEIDVSENEIYKGIYSFFEDDEGHNILDYISLLHTELIGIGKTLTNVKVMRKDMTRIADSLEKLVALKEMELEEKRHRHKSK